MTSTFTTNKGIEQPASGDYVNAWASPVNQNWGEIDAALGGTTSISVTGISAPTTTLTLAQYRPPNIEFIGTLAANLNYQIPTGVGGLWSINNATSGAFALTFSIAAGNSLTLGPGRTLIISDGATVDLANTATPLTQSSIGIVLYPQTAAEIVALVTPTNYWVPSHAATGEVYPQRYGATFDGVTNDTAAIQATFNVALQAACQVVMPSGTAIVGHTGVGGYALAFGSNSAAGASNHPPGLRGQGIATSLQAISGFFGTVLGAQGIAAQFMRDFTIDGNNIAAVCIDTSWPNTPGTTALNIYDNIIVQNFTQTGWLAINDNQSTWRAITSRGAPNFGLSGIRIEGSGGSFSLDNVVCGDCFLSITCQSVDIHGGFFRGIRFNETQSGVNYISLMGGTQIYANPTTLSHFEDAHPTTHFISSVVADGLYLLASSGTAQTFSINCGLGGKWIFNGCAFIRGGSTGLWNLYGASAIADVTPAIVELNACNMANVIIDTPAGFITERQDVQASGANLSDYPMRVVYRNTIPFASGLTINTFTNIVPAAQMAEDGTSYLVSIFINASGADNLACSALVAAVSRQSAVGPTGTIATGTTANIANNLVNNISMRYSISSNVGGVNQAGIEAACNIALPNNSTISVTLIRLANPTLNY